MTPNASFVSPSGLSFDPVSEHIGAEVKGIDLSQPIRSEQYQDLNQALGRYGVLVFRDQDLPPALHVDFSARFGPLVGHLVSRFSVEGFPQVTYISNVRNDKGEMIGADRAGMIWHSDMSYFRRPMLGSLLYGVECPPEGANTEFASMYAAHDALPDALRDRLAQLRGVHDYAWHYSTYLTHRPPLTEAERAKAPPVTHPALRTHPVSRRRAVYLSEGLTRTIEGLPEEAGRQLVVEVSEFATQPQFVYSHAWRPRDLVFWDNRCTMHRRVMRRTPVEGDEPFLD